MRGPKPTQVFDNLRLSVANHALFLMKKSKILRGGATRGNIVEMHATVNYAHLEPKRKSQDIVCQCIPSTDDTNTTHELTTFIIIGYYILI